MEPNETYLLKTSKSIANEADKKYFYELFDNKDEALDNTEVCSKSFEDDLIEFFMTEDYGKFAAFDECKGIGMDIPLWFFGINNDLKLVPINPREDFDLKTIVAVATFDSEVSFLRAQIANKKFACSSNSSYFKDFIDEAIENCIKHGSGFNPDLFEAEILREKKRTLTIKFVPAIKIDLKRVFSALFFKRATEEILDNDIIVINTPLGKAYKTNIEKILTDEEKIKELADKYDAYDITGALKKIENFKDLVSDHAFFLFAVEGNDVFLNCIRSAQFEHGEDKSKTPCLIL